MNVDIRINSNAESAMYEATKTWKYAMPLTKLPEKVCRVK